MIHDCMVNLLKRGYSIYAGFMELGLGFKYTLAVIDDCVHEQEKFHFPDWFIKEAKHTLTLNSKSPFYRKVEAYKEHCRQKCGEELL